MTASPHSVEDRRREARRFDVRRIHPRLNLGTASDRYAAWMGIVYPKDVWEGKEDTSSKRVGGESFEQRKLPVASVEDYFQHFGTLEIDFTFYRPLLEEDGKAGNHLFTLQRYADHAPANARFLLKAPQAFSAQHLRRGGSWDDNPDYLDASGFTYRFLAPALDTLGDRLSGVIFQQEYVRVRESPRPEAFVAELNAFFDEVPLDRAPVHLEVRSEHLITPPYVAWLEDRGLGMIFSHWTWLPSLQHQWRLAGERFTSRFDTAIVRLMTPRDMRYAESFKLAHPFSKPVPELAETPEASQMVNEATALIYKAIEAETTIDVICNNRAWGSSPHLAQAIAHRFLDFADRKGG